MNISKLEELTLPELESLYNLIDSGKYDENSTNYLKLEAEAANDVVYKKLLKKRQALLKTIRKRIIVSIDYILD